MASQVDATVPFSRIAILCGILLGCAPTSGSNEMPDYASPEKNSKVSGYQQSVSQGSGIHSCDDAERLIAYLNREGTNFRDQRDLANFLESANNYFISNCTDGSANVKRSDVLMTEAKRLAKNGPPEFDTSVFLCISDFEKCQSYFLARDRAEDANITCGFSYLCCIGVQLIPFLGT